MNCRLRINNRKCGLPTAGHKRCRFCNVLTHGEVCCTREQILPLIKKNCVLCGRRADKRPGRKGEPIRYEDSFHRHLIRGNFCTKCVANLHPPKQESIAKLLDMARV